MAFGWIMSKILNVQYNLVSLLMAFTAVVAVLQVALSTSYGHRCRHPALRFLQWGASAAFIPLTAYIISYYMSKIKTNSCKSVEYYYLLIDNPYDSNGQCMPGFFTELLIVWTVLVQIIKGNTDMASAWVVTDGSPVGARDAGGGSRPFVELLAYSIWTTGSFALGRNAEVIAGYMTHVYDTDKEDDGQPPRYIVMGEERQHLEKTPNGYRVKVCALQGNAITSSTLLTVDRIWHLWSSSVDPLLVSQSRLRDLCLSLSLFKSLRRRFAGYPLVEAGSRKALAFVLHGMLGDADDHDRMFRVLIDELAFASEFYYSLPWLFIGGRLAVLYIFISMLIVAGVFLMGAILLWAIIWQARSFYLIITFVLTVAVLVIELWAMMSGLRSNWTKLGLLHYYIKNNGRLCFVVQKALAMGLRFKAVKGFDDRLGQNAMLEPRRFYKPPTLFPKKLFHRAILLKSVSVPPQVKAAVLASLRKTGGRLSNGMAAIHRSKLRDTVMWSCQGDQITVDVIIRWHIATSLFEMMYLQIRSSPRTADNIVTATHLSQYCAYLVAAAPELLPDNATWTKAHYKEVAKDIKKALGRAGNNDCNRSIEALGASCRHRVLQEGSKLAKQLAGEVERLEEEDGETGGGGEAAVWKLLAEFWSEMVLYLAPSGNVEGHVEALARGGEFITLLWALLLHAGITARPGDVAEP
ncbi:hypothetical protein E2562_015204 [Oryza meyeriana var. granulata]|uniref:DUF4220 domain-containing protein n=1 Tax=Oryza meyeriana var. granulata TaxID=110450 RepID=A0A6G1EWT1_9ORYZ|nr:hypothetical protein E2562_015204 [Oryza meyeriana var. granulata]